MDRWKFVNEKWIPHPVSRGEGFVSGIAVLSYRSLPHWGRGTASAVDRVLSQTAYLRRSPPLVFHTARTLSGSLRSPPSPRGEGFVSGIPLSPPNLRPFGAPPSIGRRECPREPLPLEGAAERSEAGLASFFATKPPPLCLSHAGKALSVGIVFPHMHVFALTVREKRCSRITAFPIGEGGTRQRCSGALVCRLLETHFPTLFHTARTLSGSLRSPPSPRGEGFVRRYCFSPRILYSH